MDADRLTNNIALRLAGLLSILTLLAIAGAFGFMLTEDLDFFDALYFTIVTIGTVGTATSTRRRSAEKSWLYSLSWSA